MSLFSTYETELVDLAGQAHILLADVAASKISRTEGFKKVKDILSECEESLQGMDMEYRNAKGEEKSKLRARISSCKELLDKIRVEMLGSEKHDAATKDALLGGGDEDAVYLDMGNVTSQSQVMMESASLMRKGEDQLKAALQEAIQIEECAVDIGENLVAQRGKMEGMKDRVAGINQNLDRADSLMREMYRRMTFNKIIFGIGVGAVIGAIILVLLKVIIL